MLNLLWEAAVVFLVISLWLVIPVPLFENPFVYDLFTEAELAVLAVIALAVLGRTEVLRFRLRGLGAGLLAGGFMLEIAAMSLVRFLVSGNSCIIESRADIALYLLNCLFIGIAEEILYRGILQNAALELTGSHTPARAAGGIWIAAVLFGLAHLTNLLSGISVGAVLRQAVMAVLSGALFGAIYFRSGSLWASIFVHAAVDIAALIRLLAGSDIAEEITASAGGPLLSTIVSFAAYAAIALYAMRSSTMKQAAARRRRRRRPTGRKDRPARRHRDERFPAA